MNLFAAVSAKQPFLKSSGQEDLFWRIGDTWHSGNNVHFVIVSERTSYWRARIYDIYTSRGWTSSPVTERVLEQGVPRPEADTFSGRNELTYTVVTNLKTDILLTAGEFVSSDIFC